MLTARLLLPALPGEREAAGTVSEACGNQVRTLRLMRWNDTLHGVVDMQDLPAGVYFVRVESGGRVFAGKLVKI